MDNTIGIIIWGTKNGHRILSHSGMDSEINTIDIRNTIKDVSHFVYFNRSNVTFYAIEYTTAYKVFTIYRSVYEVIGTPGAYIAITIYIPHFLKIENIYEVLNKLIDTYWNNYVDPNSFNLLNIKEDIRLFTDILQSDTVISEDRKKNRNSSKQNDSPALVLYDTEEQLKVFFLNPYCPEFMEHQEVIFMNSKIIADRDTYRYCFFSPPRPLTNITFENSGFHIEKIEYNIVVFTKNGQNIKDIYPSEIFHEEDIICLSLNKNEHYKENNVINNEKIENLIRNGVFIKNNNRLNLRNILFEERTYKIPWEIKDFSISGYYNLYIYLKNDKYKIEGNKTHDFTLESSQLNQSYTVIIEVDGKTLFFDCGFINSNSKIEIPLREAIYIFSGLEHGEKASLIKGNKQYEIENSLPLGELYLEGNIPEPTLSTDSKYEIEETKQEDNKVFIQLRKKTIATVHQSSIQSKNDGSDKSIQQDLLDSSRTSGKNEKINLFLQGENEKNHFENERFVCYLKDEEDDSDCYTNRDNSISVPLFFKGKSVVIHDTKKIYGDEIIEAIVSGQNLIKLIKKTKSINFKRIFIVAFFVVIFVGLGLFIFKENFSSLFQENRETYTIIIPYKINKDEICIDDLIIDSCSLSIDLHHKIEFSRDTCKIIFLDKIEIDSLAQANKTLELIFFSGKEENFHLSKPLKITSSDIQPLVRESAPYTIQMRDCIINLEPSALDLRNEEEKNLQEEKEKEKKLAIQDQIKQAWASLDKLSCSMNTLDNAKKILLNDNAKNLLKETINKDEAFVEKRFNAIEYLLASISIRDKRPQNYIPFHSWFSKNSQYFSTVQCNYVMNIILRNPNHYEKEDGWGNQDFIKSTYNFNSLENIESRTNLKNRLIYEEGKRPKDRYKYYY